MTGHRITYDVLETKRGRRYSGICRCGEQRITKTPAAVSAWGPEHVVTAWEREHGR